MNNAFNDTNKPRISSIDAFFILNHDKAKRKIGEYLYIPQKGEKRLMIGWGYGYDDSKMQYLTECDINGYHSYITSNKYELP